ncbi:MAG: hypothetical protein ACRDUY_05155 [Nitriliruptorales bacterium]
MTVSSGTRSAAGREAGDIIAGWLLRLTFFLLAASFVVFEAGAVLVNAITTTDAAQQIAHAAATAYRENAAASSAESTAEAVAAQKGVELVVVTVDRQELSVTVRDRAQTLLIHAVTALERFLVRESTSTVSLE